MKVLFDFSYLNSEPRTGVAKYAFNILKAWKNKYSGDIDVLVNPIGYQFLKKSFPEYNYKIIGKKYMLNIPIISLAYLSCCCFFYSLFKTYDVIYIPWANFINWFICGKNKITTVHDIQNLKRSKGFSRLVRKLWILFVAYTSSKIIVISKYVKADLLKHRITNENKIKVIYNGVQLNNIIFKQNKTIDFPYILCVNTFLPQKNHITLIKAYNLVQSDFPHKLVLVGKKNEYYDTVLYPLIKSLKLEDKVIQMQDLSEKKLHDVYSSANLFITTSLNEGFGFTPIEAAIFKIPVICSKEEALFETTRGLLNYYEPSIDYHNLSLCIKDVLEHPMSGKELDYISKDLLNAYDFQKRANEIWNFINDKK